MPRELIHWEVLRRTSSGPAGQGWINAVLKKYSSVAQLGAILPDAPYYLQRGTSAEGQALAEFLHGRLGEDTFDPLRTWSSRIAALKGEQRACSWALWIGVLSHLVTDQVFHPMVYWLTGDYYSDNPHIRSIARRRHRLLEVYLDAFVERSSIPTYIGALFANRDELQSTESALDLFAESVAESRVGSSAPTSPGAETHHDNDLWRTSVKEIARFQRAFRSSLLGMTLRGFCSACPRTSMLEIDSLFSYGREQLPRPLQGAISYWHPVSKQSYSRSIDELCDIAAERLTSEITRCLQYFECGSPQDMAPLSPQGGTSLAFDVYGATDQDGRFFSSEWILG